jgi:hypothetical protein
MSRYLSLSHHNPKITSPLSSHSRRRSWFLAVQRSHRAFSQIGASSLAYNLNADNDLSLLWSNRFNLRVSLLQNLRRVRISPSINRVSALVISFDLLIFIFIWDLHAILISANFLES